MDFFLSFVDFLFVCLFVCLMCTCIWLNKFTEPQACRSLQNTEKEIMWFSGNWVRAMSCHVVLRSELWSSARAVTSLNHWLISPIAALRFHSVSILQKIVKLTLIKQGKKQTTTTKKPHGIPKKKLFWQSLAIIEVFKIYPYVKI